MNCGQTVQFARAFPGSVVILNGLSEISQLLTFTYENFVLSEVKSERDKQIAIHCVFLDIFIPGTINNINSNNNCNKGNCHNDISNSIIPLL